MPRENRHQDHTIAGKTPHGHNQPQQEQHPGHGPVPTETRHKWPPGKPGSSTPCPQAAELFACLYRSTSREGHQESKTPQSHSPPFLRCTAYFNHPYSMIRAASTSAFRSFGIQVLIHRLDTFRWSRYSLPGKGHLGFLTQFPSESPASRPRTFSGSPSGPPP